MTDSKAVYIDCPSCKSKTLWAKENANRPFCSQRCRDIDFCGWANEERLIDGQADYDDLLSEDLAHEKERLEQVL